VLGEKELHSSIGPIQPPRSIDPRPKPKTKVTLIKPARIAFSRCQQRPHPWPLSPPHLLKPPLHQRPILANQRNDIGHRRQRNKIQVALGLTQRTSKLPSNPGPAELL